MSFGVPGDQFQIPHHAPNPWGSNFLFRMAEYLCVIHTHLPIDFKCPPDDVSHLIRCELPVNGCYTTLFMEPWQGKDVWTCWKQAHFLWIFLLQFIYLFIYCVHVGVGLMGAFLSLSTMNALELNSGHQSRWQKPLSVKPSGRPPHPLWKNYFWCVVR